MARGGLRVRPPRRRHPTRWAGGGAPSQGRAGQGSNNESTHPRPRIRRPAFLVQSELASWNPDGRDPMRPQPPSHSPFHSIVWTSPSPPTQLAVETLRRRQAGPNRTAPAACQSLAGTYAVSPHAHTFFVSSLSYASALGMDHAPGSGQPVTRDSGTRQHGHAPPMNVSGRPFRQVPRNAQAACKRTRAVARDRSARRT